MLNHYDLRLVALSFLLSVLAAYAALDFAGQVATAKGRSRTFWLAGGAIAFSTGVWSMHFIGMLAFELPVPVQYDLVMVVLSALPPVLAAGLALCLVSRPVLGLRHVVLGSVLMGLSIAAMHYLGMAAMRLPLMARYNLSTVAASVVIAIAVSFVALWITFCLRQASTLIGSLQKVSSALLIGLAVSSMHYTGMTAVHFGPAPLPAAIFPSLDIDMMALPSLMAMDLGFLDNLISAVAGIVIGIALLISLEAKVLHQATLLAQLQQEVAHRQRVEDGVKKTLRELRAAQAALVQTEKMSSLGRLVAGISHEVNNPLGVITGNLAYLQGFARDLLELAVLCQQHGAALPAPVQAHLDELDLDFVIQDTPRLLGSMEHGASRIRDIVTALRNFSRLDEAELKPVRLTEGLEDALQLLRHRLAATVGRPEIMILRQYTDMPKVECYAGQLNQVFVKLLENAIDALDARTFQTNQIWEDTVPTVTLTTHWNTEQVCIGITDNGIGIAEAVKDLVFDPFFTTKPVGEGTGMGLAIAHQIVTQTHGGTLSVVSNQAGGTTFEICLPLHQSAIPRMPAFI
ncbi:MHYT domain-containing protein [Pseudanabaena sp. FACHB-2040]|uniref:MHYT domain-containing protein n=1 Tax=Pseudanabaena sp. FACHB-2040 TaxID=2692859 RepID=UPI00168890C5|nr:MHYT domain-containing protein [Pseudanabaena sp. FACHB-2040]MBD2260056.1 hypothetical protein [Pseudanabaena sp. FACHB-2040]